MSKTRYNLDLVFANVFFGANFSFYVSLTRNYLDFQQIFMLQVLSAAVFFILTVTIIGRAVGCASYDAAITTDPTLDRIFSDCGRGCITVRGRISATTIA